MTDRKTLLVDLDNVVYPWAEVMAVLVAKEGLTDRHPAELLQLYKSWSIWDDWQIPKGGFDFVWEKAISDKEMWGVGNEGARSITSHAIMRASTALWTLSDREWHIHLITHRLNKFRLHDQAVINTAEWLKQENIPYRSLTFTEDKNSVMGDVIIDDNPDNLLNHPAPVKILYPAQHNRQFQEEDAEPEGIITLLRPDNDEGMEVHPWDEIVTVLGDGVRS